MNQTRVVITGMGQVSPLGIGLDPLWESMRDGRSGIKALQRIPGSELSTQIGGEATDFTGHIDDFGDLEKTQKRSIKKGLKLMCREIEMGVAAAQWAIANAGLEPGGYDPERCGCLFGSDYIMTVPEEFSAAIAQCQENGEVDFERWGEEGIPKVEPLWLLKYLPNMPASHVAIYNDLRGPSNSLTVREASSNMAVAEGYTTIRRGSADLMVCGSTGTRIHLLRSVHTSLQEQLAQANGDPAQASRPFDKNRTGMVIGEGAGAMILESLESAEKRGANIFAEVIGFSSSTVADKLGNANHEQAFLNVITGALESAEMSASELGHVHAHGLSTLKCDQAEAAALAATCPDTIVTAAKSFMGNLGAGSGLVEMITSVLALQNQTLFPLLNYETPDEKCPIKAAQTGDDPGRSFINLNITPQGQASSIVIRAWD